MDHEGVRLTAARPWPVVVVGAQVQFRVRGNRRAPLNEDGADGGGARAERVALGIAHVHDVARVQTGLVQREMEDELVRQMVRRLGLIQLP